MRFNSFKSQNDWRFAALDFGLDLIQVPKSNFAAAQDVAQGPGKRHVVARLDAHRPSVQLSDTESYGRSVGAAMS
jgi:hypothetical protein